MGVTARETDVSRQDQRTDPYPDETIESLTAECGELAGQISSAKDRMERYMLVTGGASDESDRMQEKIDDMEGSLASAEKRLQKLLDAQEKEFFAPTENRVEKNKNVKRRVSVRKTLAEKKAKIAASRGNNKEKARKSPSMDTAR